MLRFNSNVMHWIQYLSLFIIIVIDTHHHSMLISFYLRKEVNLTQVIKQCRQ